MSAGVSGTSLMTPIARTTRMTRDSTSAPAQLAMREDGQPGDRQGRREVRRDEHALLVGLETGSTLAGFSGSAHSKDPFFCVLRRTARRQSHLLKAWSKETTQTQEVVRGRDPAVARVRETCRPQGLRPRAGVRRKASVDVEHLLGRLNQRPWSPHIPSKKGSKA